MRHRFTAPAGGRLDKLIADNTPLSRHRAKSLIAKGGVWVDGRRAERESQRIDAGAVVDLRTVPSQEAAAEAPRVPERYREAGILVVDKPAGLPTQPERQGGRLHLHGLLQRQEAYVGLHHRLDTPASGLVLVTLDRAWNRSISEGFQQHAIQRDYLVVVLGDPGPGGRWSAPLDGEPAGTRWRRIAAGEGISALEVSLETGRTHQIRRHAAGAGHPVLGDRRYGGAAGRAWPRLALHAWRLRFRHPAGGEAVTVTAPPPADLRPLLEQAGWEGAGDGEE